MPIVLEHNTETNEIIEREMTPVELKQYKLNAKESELKKSEAEAKAIAKAAILDRLGLTADELQTILG